MTSSTLDLSKILIKNFEPKEASREFWNQYHDFTEEIHTEIYPVDPLPNREVVEKDLEYISPDYHVIRWQVYKDVSEKELIASCVFNYCKEQSSIYEENKDVSLVNIVVAKKYRRKGICSKILKEIITELEKLGIKYIKALSNHQTGWDYCEKRKTKLLNVMKRSRLVFKDLDWDMVERWVEEGKKRNPNVRIEQFFGASEDNIEEYSETLTDLMNESPTLEDDTERDKEIITPDRFREYVQFLENKTYKLFTMRSIEPDNKISGLTEIRFSEVDNPNIISQALTGVRSMYRGRGLGKWLKAKMLLYIRENHPEREYFVTGNAEHNAPMLSINNRLGFKPYKEDRLYKFTIVDLKQIIN